MYYLVLVGNQAGPFTQEQVGTLWRAGQINGETLFWQEGMAGWEPLQLLEDLFNTEAPPSHRIIGGFWPRLGAYAIDSLLLLGVGWLLGLCFSTYFSQMGAWALLVGFAISLCYFGVLNSSLGGGRTVGKRLLGLEVVDREGLHLSPSRSVLRYVLFATPFYLNGVLSSGAVNPVSWPAWVLGLVVFSGGGAIFYLYVFNRATRQSLHDLAVGSYVVRTEPAGPVVAPPLWRGHLLALGAYGVVLIGLLVAGLALMHLFFFQKLLAVQEAVVASGKVQSASINEGVNVTMSNESTQSNKVLTVAVRWKGEPDAQAADEIAALVLKSYPDITSDDVMRISIVRGYNIGIFSSSSSDSVARSPAEWAVRTGVQP